MNQDHNHTLRRETHLIQLYAALRGCISDFQWDTHHLMLGDTRGKIENVSANSSNGCHQVTLLVVDCTGCNSGHHVKAELVDVAVIVVPAASTLASQNRTDPSHLHKE